MTPEQQTIQELTIELRQLTAYCKRYKIIPSLEASRLMALCDRHTDKSAAFTDQEVA